ncbi:porin [Endozoicomonas lisbonensis]|uniref:Porin n=1 Tax=Endozoicomonas lisbonensis TaxID=3120522 RepID=A0ABV2SGH6_9GAMM
MQKKLLATVVASLVAGQAMALEVYNDDTTSLSIGGRVGLVAEKANGKKAEMNNDSARLNMKFAHKFDNGWTGHGVTEWGFRAQDEYKGGEKSDTFFNRLGFVGLSHDEMGSIHAGKNWSVMYDVSGWTDMYAIGGGNAMGIYNGRNGGDTDGSARADDVLQYRNSFGGLNVGAQYQLAGDTQFSETHGRTFKRNEGYGIALSYDLPMGLSLGATYSETKYKDEKGTDFAGQDKAKSTTFGVKFDNEMVYAAAMYGEFRNVTSVDSGLDQKSTGIELFAQLNLPQVMDGFAVYTGYNQLDADKAQKNKGKNSTTKTDAQFKEYALGAVYKTGPMQFAFEWATSRDKDVAGNKDKDDTYSIQARYYF